MKWFNVSISQLIYLLQLFDYKFLIPEKWKIFYVPNSVTILNNYVIFILKN